MAIQGPMAVAAIEKVTELPFGSCSAFHFMEWSWKKGHCFVARTGYTGEDGGEIFVPREWTEDLWEYFFEQCPEAEPIGLGARNTLRMEMTYPLYGQDMDDKTFPQELGLDWVVKFDKGNFIGRTEMMACQTKGPAKKQVGLEVIGRGIAREGYKVFSIDNKEVGIVTSGTLSPSLDKAIAMAYVPSSMAEPGKKVFIGIRGKMVEAEIVKTPFYKKGKG